MPQVVKSYQGDTLDLVIYRTLGVVDDALLAEAFALNPEIAGYGVILPTNTDVTVPDMDIVQPKRTIKLYD